MNAGLTKLNRNDRYPPGRLFAWALLPLLMGIVFVGCKQEPTIATDVNPSDTYTLVSVDGNEVPCTVDHDGTSLAVASGVFTINADGTCSSLVAFSLPSGEEASREVKATYTREGSTLTMDWEGAGTTTGGVESDTFTMNNEGMVFHYSR